MNVKILHIIADFDEKDLNTNEYSSSDQFVSNVSDNYKTLGELTDAHFVWKARDSEDFDDDYTTCDHNAYRLLVLGESIEGEWQTEALYRVIL